MPCLLRNHLPSSPTMSVRSEDAETTKIAKLAVVFAEMSPDFTTSDMPCRGIANLGVEVFRLASHNHLTPCGFPFGL